MPKSKHFNQIVHHLCVNTLIDMLNRDDMPKEVVHQCNKYLKCDKVAQSQ